MKLFFSALIGSTISAVSATSWSVLDVSLPKPISDHTASVGENGLIYIAGGCDAPDGNVFLTFEDGSGFFVCNSLSSSLYAFDTATREFTSLLDLPRPRYRHSSAIVNGQLWLVGGRTLEDSLISEVDIYDIESGTWSSVTLPLENVVSDHASFAQSPSSVYIAGGYDQDYTAQSNVYRIDTSTLGADVLAVELHSKLNTARGDVIGVASTDGTAAFVAGGFTHENGFCAALDSTERLTFADGEWRDQPNLIGERGEVALVEVDNVLYALGGERPIEGSCNEGFEVDPGEQTVGTDEVEVLLPDEGAWSIISGFPEHTFRFAAAAGSDGLIYAFGGQSVFDTACDCQRTSDEIRVFDSESVDDAVEAGEGEASENSEDSASNPALSPAGIAIVILASVFMM